MERVMKVVHIVIAAAIAASMPVASTAQVAGSTFLGASYTELRDVAVGWSAKRQILGHPVYNNMEERVGSVDDIIVTTDKAVSYAIVNAGGFLAVAKHNVAIPVSQLKLEGDKLVLPGATRDSLKAAPEFEYAN
jgi:sporulation protein YlmC with PRC-barrel domain